MPDGEMRSDPGTRPAWAGPPANHGDSSSEWTRPDPGPARPTGTAPPERAESPTPHARPLRRSAPIVIVAASLAAGILGGRLAGREEAPPAKSAPPPASSAAMPSAPPAADFASVYEALAPSVVHIVSERRRGDSIGSGVIVDIAGTIITNNHVVPDPTARVTLADGTEHDAAVIGRDVTADLAVLRLDVPPPGLVPARFGDPGALRIGDPVAAIGSPFGLRGSLSTGVVSGLDRVFPGNDEYPRIEGLIQTDAAINPGNSGGPLINAAGEVVGLTTAIESPVRGSVGVGFAVPIETVRAALAAITERV